MPRAEHTILAFCISIILHASIFEFDPSYVQLCESHGVRIFSDEMYCGLEHGLAEPLCSAVQLAGACELGHIALGGLSKWGAMPGLRIGWLVSADSAVMRRVNELKDYTTICPASPSEVSTTI